MSAEKCPECGVWWRGQEHRCVYVYVATTTSEPALSPRTCTDPACAIKRRSGFPMHGPHDFIAEADQ